MLQNYSDKSSQMLSQAKNAANGTEHRSHEQTSYSLAKGPESYIGEKTDFKKTFWEDRSPTCTL